MTNSAIIQPLPPLMKAEMLAKKVWQAKCPIPLERLRLIKFRYYDFSEVEHNDGQITVLDAVAEHVCMIFKDLHSLRFPLSKAQPLEHYDGSDAASMADNNSSCFNFRTITDGSLLSLHSYGVAIDINPVQNPYLSSSEKDNTQIEILPYAGREYVNRTNLRKGMVEPIVKVFQENGFSIWGGKWNNPIDWQHFQPSRTVAEILAAMSPADAFEFFTTYAKEPKFFNNTTASSDSFISLYKKNPVLFLEFLRKESKLLSSDPQEGYKRLTEISVLW